MFNQNKDSQNFNKEDQELSSFLFLDYPYEPNGVIRRKEMEEFLIKDRGLLIKRYNKYKIPFFISDNLFFGLLKMVRRGNKKNILFQNSKHSTIILEVKKHHNVGLITQGFRDRLFAIKNFMGYMGVNDLDQLIYGYLKEGNIKYIHQLVEKIKNTLKIVKPDYIVLRSDAPPLERAIIFAGKKLGITTIEIQHGIYNPSAIPLVNGRAADYVFVWGEHFKKLYVEHNIRKSEDIYVLGYPFLVDNKKTTSKKGVKYKVCYLGEDFERYNKDLLEIKLKTIKSIFEICNKLGLDFIYRPHPWEDRSMVAEKLPGIQFTEPKEKIGETFDNADIFISFSSTALAEAAIKSKISLQLMSYPMEMENFEKLGVCNKSFNNITELEDHLAKIAVAPNMDDFRTKFNNFYIETRRDPGKRFLEIIKEIENKKIKLSRPKIAITHPRLITGGGSEACAMQAVQALKNEYDVTLMTMGEPDIEKLNECFGTDIKKEEIKIIALSIPRLFKNRFDALRGYKLARLVRKVSKDFDVMVSTYNLMDLGKRGIQFVAGFSFDDKLRETLYPEPKKSNKWFYKDTFLRKCYLKLAEILPGGSKENFKKNITIANSEWTKEILKKYRNIDSKVIYPPVADNFPQIPFNKKEDGFICLSRISPEKQIEKIIEIIEKVRETHPDVHLHIIGKPDDLRYTAFIKKLCDKNKKWCFWEGPMYGEKKLEFIARHKFGISGCQNEPFGIAVAEMVKSGAVVFVPDGGGQVEIAGHKDLIFKDEEDAVEKINKILKSESVQNYIRDFLSAHCRKFSAEEFRSEIKKLVRDFLEEKPTANADIENYSKYKQFYADQAPQLMSKYLKATQWENFLDLGCGDGALLYALNKKEYSEKNIYAVDLSEKRVELAKKINKNFICFVADACNIPQIKDNAINFLASIQVIEHVKDDEKMVREMDRLVAKNGIVYLSTVFKKWYGWYFYRCNGKWALDPTHFREYTSDGQLIDIFKKYNFEIMENKKTLTYRPIIDFVFRKFGLSKNAFAKNHFLRILRGLKIPVFGYYNWEIVCKKK